MLSLVLMLSRETGEAGVALGTRSSCLQPVLAPADRALQVTMAIR